MGVCDLGQYTFPSYEKWARPSPVHIAKVKRFNDSKFKVVHIFNYDAHHVPGIKGSREGNGEKFDQSISRARQRCFELAYANYWEWFVTLTLSPEKYDRFDLKQYIKDLSQMIRDYRKKTGLSVKYLFVPERHDNGAWHMHGFLTGVDRSDIHFFNSCETLPYSILDRLAHGHIIGSWIDYSKRFGYMTMEEVENNDAATRYIIKYINKDVSKSVVESNAHLFYASQGLKSAEEIYSAQVFHGLDNPDFVSDFCEIKWFDNIEETTQIFL